MAVHRKACPNDSGFIPVTACCSIAGLVEVRQAIRVPDPFPAEAVRDENIYTNMVAIEQVLEVLAESLPLAQDLRKMGENAPLLGAIPELDSMAITAIIVGMEERFNIVFDENELDAQAFETAGTLRQVVASKLASQAECKGS